MTGYLFTNIATHEDKINLVWEKAIKIAINRRIVAPIIKLTIVIIKDRIMRYP